MQKINLLFNNTEILLCFDRLTYVKCPMLVCMDCFLKFDKVDTFLILSKGNQHS